AIIEHVLGIRIVYCEHREFENTLLLHTAQTNHTGRCLFQAADNGRDEVGTCGMKSRNEITAVIHCHIRLVIKDSINMAIVGWLVLALNGKGGNAIHAHQGSGNLILGRKWVGSAEYEIRSTSLQGNRQIRRLSGNMQAARHTNPFEG